MTPRRASPSPSPSSSWPRLSSCDLRWKTSRPRSRPFLPSPLLPPPRFLPLPPHCSTLSLSHAHFLCHCHHRSLNRELSIPCVFRPWYVYVRACVCTREREKGRGNATWCLSPYICNERNLTDSSNLGRVCPRRRGREGAREGGREGGRESGREAEEGYFGQGLRGPAVGGVKCVSGVRFVRCDWCGS